MEHRIMDFDDALKELARKLKDTSKPCMKYGVILSVAMLRFR
jgi:hypothetical protein